MSKIMIAFTTKMGMSKKTAEILSNVLTEKFDFRVNIFDLKQKKIGKTELQNYKSIIIGSGIRMKRWYKQSLKFLRNDFSKKNIFVYICSMGATNALTEGNIDSYNTLVNQYLDNIVASNQSINLLSKAVFGGKKKDKGDMKRENWNENDVETWANEIGEIISEMKNKQE